MGPWLWLSFNSLLELDDKSVDSSLAGPYTFVLVLAPRVLLPYQSRCNAPTLRARLCKLEKSEQTFLKHRGERVITWRNGTA